jgi:hypothetical protein
MYVFRCRFKKLSPHHRGDGSSLLSRPHLLSALHAFNFRGPSSLTHPLQKILCVPLIPSPSLLHQSYALALQRFGICLYLNPSPNDDRQDVLNRNKVEPGSQRWGVSASVSFQHIVIIFRLSSLFSLRVFFMVLIGLELDVASIIPCFKAQVGSAPSGRL